MKVIFYINNQIGLMIEWGITFERRKYISLEIPFLIIQFCGRKPKNRS